MRILLITHFFPPQRNAGTENYTLGLAQALLRRGHEVEVVCAGDWDRGPRYWNGVTEDDHGGVAVRRMNLNWAVAGDPNQVLYASGATDEWLSGHLSNHRPDVVHVTSTMTLGLGALAAPRRHGIPTALTLMDFWFLCPRTVLTRADGELCDGRTTPWECLRCLLSDSNVYRRVAPWIPGRLQASLWSAAAAVPRIARTRGMRGMALDMRDRMVSLREALTWPHVLLAHSVFVREMFASAGLSQRVRHLANGHDLRWLAEYRGKTSSPWVRVGYVGQLTRAKGVHLLIEAFKRAGLGARGRLEIWGDQAMDPAYSERLGAAAANCQHVALRGRFSREQLASVFEEIDVLVVPSTWYENAPLVIQEAFASRTPVVATKLGGMAEAVTHGVNGLLFERGDVADLARQLTRVAKEPTLLASLAAGIPAVKTIDQEVDELEVVYEGVIKGRSNTVTRGGSSVEDDA